ncbi:MAG: hypothetical protein FWD87_09100 [Spirochaetaceae bacterium]|nr:hypothetical protein [Spirochaetaceae bacterium]
MLEVNPAGKKIGNESVRYSGSITVVENVSDKHFKVRAESLAGLQEFTVFSKNNLFPGDTIKGAIISKGNSLYLSIFSKQQNNPLFSASSDAKSQISEKTDIIPRFLVSFLDSTGKKADNILLAILESLVSKKKITDLFCATLAGEAYLKGFKSESAISAFLNAVDPDHDKKQGGQKQGKKDHKKEDIKEVLSKAVSDSEQEENPLFVFNHLSLPDKNWIIIPFKVDNIKGDLRLKTIENELKNLIIHVEKDHFKWFFELSDFKSPQKTVKIYANKEGLLACQGEKFDLFKKKLQSIAVIIDDNIYDINIFNGFSRISASYDVDLRI